MFNIWIRETTWWSIFEEVINVTNQKKHDLVAIAYHDHIKDSTLSAMWQNSLEQYSLILYTPHYATRVFIRLKWQCTEQAMLHPGTPEMANLSEFQILFISWIIICWYWWGKNVVKLPKKINESYNLNIQFRYWFILSWQNEISTLSIPILNKVYYTLPLLLTN